MFYKVQLQRVASLFPDKSFASIQHASNQNNHKKALAN